MIIYECQGETYRAHELTGNDHSAGADLAGSDHPAGADYIIRRDSDGRFAGYVTDLARNGVPAPDSQRFEAYDNAGHYLTSTASLKGAVAVFARADIRWIQD